MSGYLSQSCINDERRIFPRSAWQLRKTSEPARLVAAEAIRERPVDGFWRLRCDIEARTTLGTETRPAMSVLFAIRLHCCGRMLRNGLR
jgi:hypothetical protein